MIDAKRIAELKKKAERFRAFNLEDYSDLLSILSDYEAALPLLEAVKATHPEDLARNLTAASNYCARIVVEANGYVNRIYEGKEPTP